MVDVEHRGLAALEDDDVTGIQRFGLFATIVGLGGDGLVPISTLGAERFFHDEASRTLTGERSGTVFAMGDRLKLRLAEANPQGEPPQGA